VKSATRQYTAFVLAVALLVGLAAIPVAASDLFRQPYSPAWPAINRAIARLRIDYNPPGGGEAPRYPSWRDPADAYLYYRDVALTAADGVHLSGWYVPAVEAAAPTVVLCHGLLTESKWSMLRLVPWLHETGHNVLLFDFRGHGGSDARPSTVGREERLDVEAALDWLDAEGVGDSVAGLGMSMGAAALVNAAAEDERLDALILDSLFADWSDVDYARGYRLPPDWLVPNVPSPAELIPEVHAPVLIIHGTADILTEVEHAHRLYAAAHEPKQIWINDSGHAWSAWTYPDQYQALVLAFLEAALRRGQHN